MEIEHVPSATKPAELSRSSIAEEESKREVEQPAAVISCDGSSTIKK